MGTFDLLLKHIDREPTSATPLLLENSATGDVLGSSWRCVGVEVRLRGLSKSVISRARSKSRVPG